MAIQWPWEWASQALQLLRRIDLREQHIMAAIDDLKQAVVDLGTALTAEIQAIEEKLANLPNQDAAIQDITASVTSLRQTVEAETQKLTA